ncbi:Phosphotyrosyl phosphatase activator [Trametes gibbosa]|nr:Phosphotyrosyl phosphatase activator [Trametes gibbosa]
MTPNIVLPALREVTIASLHPSDRPVLRIKTDEDVVLWKNTRGYQDYGLFLRRLADSVVGYELPYNITEPNPAVTALVQLLDQLDLWIDEIPPLPTPQRFGNLAFRTWGKRLETECETLLHFLLPTALHPSIPFISPYLLTSFGSFTRMDYGTGHETSFALFLLCLALLRFLCPEPRVERQLVLCVFVRYMRLCWRLQDVYRLEPAGSHGVWGLDDYSFLSYVFGSAQLRDQTEIAVSAVLRNPLPPTNLYFMSIMRILQVKSGPFHEHSSQLYSIATGVQYWSKVHSGLFKMYEAEVLGKRVVVQHVPLGGLLEWNIATSTSATAPTNDSQMSATAAPWASSAPYGTSMPSPAPFAAATYPVPPPSFATHNFHMHPAGRRASPGAPFVPARAPLGPTASSAVRGAVRPGMVPRTLASPPSATHAPAEGDDHPRRSEPRSSN